MSSSGSGTENSAKLSTSVICEEVFDDEYQPSNEEIKDYAVKIGIDPEKEPYLLYLARDGLMQALPPDWQPCYNEKFQAYYYHNKATKITQWDHPLDPEYKGLVKKARKKIIDDPSEDLSLIDSGIKSLQGNEEFEIVENTTDVELQQQQQHQQFNKMESVGSGFSNRFIGSLDRKGGAMLKSLDPIRQTSGRTITVAPVHIGLSMKTDDVAVKGINNLVNVRDEKPQIKGFSLTGTGSMFLKSNVKKDLTISKPIDILDWKDSSSEFTSMSPTVKGILRDSSLSDVRTKNDIKFGSLDLEDRKSVRFNLDGKSVDTPDSEENKKLESKEYDNPDESSDESSSVGEQSDDGWDVMEVKPENNYVTEVRLGLNKIPEQLTTIKPPFLRDRPPLGKTLISFGKNVSTESDTDRLSLILDRNNSEQKIVKPLYDGSDSESGSSIKISNKKTLSGNLLLDGRLKEDEEMEIKKLRAESKERMDLYKETLQREQKEEEIKLRNEMKISLEETKEKLLEQNKAEADMFEVEVLRASNKQELEKILGEERRRYQLELESTLEKLERENDIRIKQELVEEEEKFRKMLENEKREIDIKHKEAVTQLIKDMSKHVEEMKADIEKENLMEIDSLRMKLRCDFEEKRQEIVSGHRAAEEILQKNHSEILEELERDLKTEEELLKKDHCLTLGQMKEKLSHELGLERQRMRESGEDRLYEKIRCEKRLLEDKYRCLKEKYVRLKTDVKLSLERRNNRRREQQSLTTGSETERSNSNHRSTPISAPIDFGRPPQTPSTPKQSAVDRPVTVHGVAKEKKLGAATKYLKHVQQYDDTTSISQSDTTVSNHFPRIRYLADNGNSDSEAIKAARNHYNNNNNNNFKDTPGRQRKKIFTRMKSASTSRLNSSNNKKDPLERPCTPVENLRRQLQKLEDLEDQFPDNSLDTTYHLRYPFTDVVSNHKGSSELEFFKHRIHLERDSVRRAKESLRTQRTNFRMRQREIKLRHKSIGRHTIDQLIQEEKELTEMEVNLHRTHALLGEKVIRLRHLEQSLQRIYEKEKPGGDYTSEDNRSNNKDDATLSDLSSHSSSGFSSTDFQTDTNQTNRQKQMYQESSEIIQSLENLNAEIKEIWEILSKQQSHGLTPPPSIFYPDMSWPLITPATLQNIPSVPVTTSVLQQQQPIPTLADRLETYRQLAANGRSAGVTTTTPAATIVSQSLTGHYTTSLVERTRDLRNWLKQAKNEHEMLNHADL